MINLNNYSKNKISSWSSIFVNPVQVFGNSCKNARISSLRTSISKWNNSKDGPFPVCIWNHHWTSRVTLKRDLHSNQSNEAQTEPGKTYLTSIFSAFSVTGTNKSWLNWLKVTFITVFVIPNRHRNLLERSTSRTTVVQSAPTKNSCHVAF